MSTEKMKIEKGLYIIKSMFGWMIKGRAKSQEGNEHENAMLIMTHSTNNILPEMHQFTHVEPSQQPAPDINKFSKLETIFIVPPEKTKVDDGVMQHLINTVIQENGRYQVAWLGNDISVYQKTMN